MAFLYEVNLEIDAHRAAEFEEWLGAHIEEMLSFPGFLSAEWYHRFPEDEGNIGDVTLWTIHYALDSEASFLRYVENNAPRMRAEGIALFGNNFRASRRLLHSKRSFLT